MGLIEEVSNGIGQLISFAFGAVLIIVIIAIIVAVVQKSAEENRRQERAQKESEERQKRIKQREREKYINSWNTYFNHKYSYILENVKSLEQPLDYGSLYKEIKDGKKDIPANEIEIKKNSLLYENEHINNLHIEIKKALSDNDGRGPTRLSNALKAISCLKWIVPEEKPYADIAYKKVNRIFDSAIRDTQMLQFSSYGELKQGGVDNELFAGIFPNPSDADEMLESFENINNDISDGTCKSVAEKLPELFVSASCALMWYYASKKPFEQGKFVRACELFEKYTLWNYQGYTIPNVEEVLAKIYSKKSLGGEGTANQEKDFVNKWIDGFLLLKASGEDKYNEEDNQELYILANGLAWMELYDMELDVLRKLVSGGVQLEQEVQTRLSYLESGGRTDIRIYTEIPSGIFAYDSSATDWGKKEFEAFFRKLVHKNIVPEYSLALEKWTKTLPLMKGQKVSSDELQTSFEEMVEDFEGEIICRQVRSEAIDLANVFNEHATLFTFTKERSRCVSLLFSCEKYGRNLNIEILTLFTPEKGVELEQLEKYCAAIKGNVYVSSFRETILQTVDEALKIKEEMYGEIKKSPKVFE